MASPVKQPAVATVSSGNGGCYDPLDLDAFINYDQLHSLSPSQSPLAAPVPAAVATANPNNTLLRPDSRTVTTGGQQQQSFGGPSHQYELHKQQTGLPVGALANTLAINEAANLNALNLESGFGLAADDAMYDFMPSDDLLHVASSSHHPSVSASSDVDMEFEKPNFDALTPLFFPESATSSTTPIAEVVDPGMLAQAELPTASHQSTTLARPSPNPAGRPWPGMHQQQAALAKARQQEEQQRRQQKSAARRSKSAAPSSLDVKAEQKISELLSSMRRASAAGASHRDVSPQSENLLPHVGRMRKDEDEMDEDERLLASEEGKKLSSKERRQLRNKVSARAFRSRRKEYISQLEAELAAKGKEANDLRLQNQALIDENTRLSDLTRMLLSSPAFSTFLDQLSANPAMGAGDSGTHDDTAAPVPHDKDIESSNVADVSTTTSASITGSLPQPVSQDMPHIGMTLVPDPPVDLSILAAADSNAWAFGGFAPGTWGNNQPQVFSVLEIPDGPAVDHEFDPKALSDKAAALSPSMAFSGEAKTEPSTVPSISASTPEEICSTTTTGVDDQDADPAFEPFADPLSTGTPRDVGTCCASSEALSGKERSQPTLAAAVSVEDCEDALAEDDRMERFHRLCAAVETSYQRICRITSRL